MALVRCITALEKLKADGDEQIGINIVKRALQEPLRQIAKNAGEEGAIVLGKVNDAKDNNFGYNALAGEYEDLVKAGVLDRPRSCDSPDQCRLDRFADAHYRSSRGRHSRRKEGHGRSQRHGEHVSGTRHSANCSHNSDGLCPSRRCLDDEFVQATPAGPNPWPSKPPAVKSRKLQCV